MSTPVLVLVNYGLIALDLTNYWLIAGIANFIGALIFFPVDKWILREKKVQPKTMEEMEKAFDLIDATKHMNLVNELSAQALKDIRNREDMLLSDIDKLDDAIEQSADEDVEGEATFWDDNGDVIEFKPVKLDDLKVRVDSMGDVHTVDQDDNWTVPGFTGTEHETRDSNDTDTGGSDE